MTGDATYSPEEIRTEVLAQRERIVGEFERVSQQAQSYRSRSVGTWTGTIPVAVAPAVESQWTFDESSSDVFGSVDGDLLQSSLERSGLSAEQVAQAAGDHVAVLNSAVGSALELDVHEMFQTGQLVAPVGTDSVVLLGRTNPGADFGFLNSSGDVVGLMNTKASSGFEIIAHHFERYPEVNYVYATHDAAVDAARHGFMVVDGTAGHVPFTDQPVVVDVGRSSVEYRDAMNDFVSGDSEGVFGLLDGDSLLKSLPWITIGVLAYRAARRHKSGSTFDENKKATIRDSMRSGTAYGVSVAMQAAGIPIPITMATSMFSAAAVEGFFRVRDEWGALAALEESLTARAEVAVNFRGSRH